MGVIILHPDQTTKQPVVWRCHNPACASPLGAPHEFEGDYPRCPKCASEGAPNVQKRSLIHLLVSDSRGPIHGHNSRFSLACDATRTHLATFTNGEAATGNLACVNCPGCLQIAGERMLRDQGQPIPFEDR